MSKVWEWLVSFIGGDIEKFFSDVGPAGRKYPNRLPIVRIFLWIFASPLIIGSILVALISLRFLILYQYLSFTYKLNLDLPDFYSTSIDTKLNILSILTVVFIFLFIFQSWNSISSPFSIKNLNANLLISLGITIFSIWSLLPSSQKVLIDFIESEAYYRVVLLTSDEKYDQALTILNPLRELTANMDMKSQTESQLIEIQSNLEQFKLSIENRVRIINLNIESGLPTDTNAIQNLHEDLFAYANKVGIGEAERFLQELAEKYPRIDVNPIWAGVGKATSPIWLGVSLENFQYLAAGDVYSIGVESLEERAVLQGLVARHPDDPLVDWARLILGEHKEIADKEPYSRVRDWAIYKTGLNSYLELDFPGCVDYFSQFLTDFPSHRWADDAAYRIARCYELQEEYELAVTYALMATELPDGKFDNLENYIAMYAIALVDNYFDASRLESYISQIKTEPGFEHFLPLLEYCLAEQLFKEARYLEASSAFQQFQSKYPTSREAQYVSDNLLLIDQIVNILGENYPNNVFDLAIYLMEDPTSWGSFAYVYYNDAYSTGGRLLGLNNIGKSGPSLSYFQETNDHLRAIQLLEEFIAVSPSHDRVPEALYWQIIGYYNLTFGYSFLPSNLNAGAQFLTKDERLTLSQEELNIERDMLGENLSNYANRLLIEYPNSQYTPEALTIAGLAFDNLNDHRQAEQYMRLVVDRYPTHNLANNSLIYIARMYRRLAFFTGTTDAREIELKRDYLEQSIMLYTEVINRYPSGHVGDEAEEERAAVQETLNSLTGQ